MIGVFIRVIEQVGLGIARPPQHLFVLFQFIILYKVTHARFALLEDRLTILPFAVECTLFDAWQDDRIEMLAHFHQDVFGMSFISSI